MSVQAARLGGRRGTALSRLRRATWNGERIEWSAYLFLLPFFVPFLVLTLGAILFGTFVSFTDWGIVGDPNWVGLDNYVKALSDPWVPRIWGNTLKYGLFVAPTTTIVALLFALFVNQRCPGRTVGGRCSTLPTWSR